MANLTKSELNILTEGVKTLERYKDRLEYETALQVFAQKLSTHGKVRHENVCAYAYRLDGIRMVLPFVDWVGIATNGCIKDKKIHAEALKKLLTEDMNKLYRYITDNKDISIEYYDYVKDGKGKVKSVKARLVERRTSYVEIK